MAKRVSVLALAILLITTMCLSLVACDDPTSVGFKFSKDMTADEIIDAINNLKSFTVVGRSGNATMIMAGESISYYGEHCASYPDISYGNSDAMVYELYEDGVYYYYNEASKIYIKKNATEQSLRESVVYSANRYIEAGDYTIEDGNLKLGRIEELDSYWIVIKDMNKTKVKTPSEFSDYKSREFTA